MDAVISYKEEFSGMIKLIATDVDGTLLNTKGEIPKRFEQVIEALKQKGILFVIASGRQYDTLVQNFKAVKEDLLFIAENGTYIVYKGEALAVNPLQESTAHELIKKARQLEDCAIVLATTKGAYVENTEERFLKEVNKYYINNHIVADLLEVKGDILKVTLCDFKGAETNSYPVFKDYESKVQVALAGHLWLDMMAIGVNKGQAIENIRQEFDITYEDSMAFGDYLNDYEMLQSVYHSYAMANAHPAIKEVARFIALSNDEDGVIKKIEETVLGDAYEK